MISNRAQRMALNFLIRQFIISSNSFPFKTLAGDNFKTGVRLFGPPTSRGLNTVRISDNSIVLSPIFVHNSRILFIDQILFA